MTLQPSRYGGGDVDRNRVPIELAGRATREAIAAACAGRVTVTDLRVLGAVLTFTTSWSRLTDRVSLGQLVTAAGIPPTDDPRVAEKRVARSLTHLAELGAVVYQPGGGRGRASLVGVPVPTGTRMATPIGDEKGTDPERKGYLSRSEKGAQIIPLPEKTSRELLPRRRRGGFAAPSFSDRGEGVSGSDLASGVEVIE